MGYEQWHLEDTVELESWNRGIVDTYLSSLCKEHDVMDALQSIIF